MAATIDDRGRVLIPKEIRERLDLEAGARVLIDVDEDGLHLRPALPRQDALDRLMGAITEENARQDGERLDPMDAKKIWEPDP